MLIERNIDILCISETWLTANIPDSFIHISQYNIYRCDKDRGGGVCIYVRENLKVTQINLNIPRTEGIEDLWISVQCRKLPSIIVGCIYRHPHSPNASFEYLLQSFRSICLKNKPFFLLGDLNDDQLIPNSKLYQAIKMSKLKQLISKPTRITNSSSTLLDVIITNMPERVIETEVSPTEIADHELISLSINITKPKLAPVIKTTRCFKNYTKDYLCNSILNKVCMLNKILNTDDVNSQLDIFNNVFTDCLNTCAPYVTKTVGRPYAPWITEEIRAEINIRNSLQTRLKNDPSNQTLRNEYKQKKNAVKPLINNAKLNYYKERLKTCNDNDTWKIINEIVPRKSRSTLKYDNVETKVNEFNNFFANVGKKTFDETQEKIRMSNEVPVNLDTPTDESDLNSPLFRPQPTSVEKIMLVINRLKNSNAFGSDEIPTRFIKDSVFVTAYYITVIVNTSIVTGFFPSLWKYSLVNPKLKKGDVDNPSNFRPLSILPVLSKVLERIVADQLMTYLESKDLISKTQHGFRKQLSTETALLQITNAIYKNIDDKKISLLMLCDLSKAFDSVSHEVLMRKSLDLQIDTFWFKDYLKNRIQSVRIENTISDTTKV